MQLPTRESALALLQDYNTEAFHIRHGKTVEAVMGYLAHKLGYGDTADYWQRVGLLHDIDFGKYPEDHCVKCVEILRANGYDNDDFIHAVTSHGYGMCSSVQPTHQMEKVLFATDELTGLIGAAALMRPSKSTKDMELSSLKKKFKDKKFAAGCNRDVITQGAAMLGWELDQLLADTLAAMQATEDDI